MNKAAKYAVIILVFAALGATVVTLVMRPRDADSNGPAPEASVNVVVKVVEPTTLPDAILLPASVEPLKSVVVAAEISGAVEWIGVEEGAAVTEGQEIAKIDTRTMKAQLDRARADYDLAASEFARTEKLRAGNIASDEQYQAGQAAVAVSKAALEVAQLTLEKATIVAPVSGTLNERYVERGEYVKGGDPVAKIVQVTTVKVVVDVPEKDIKYVLVGTILGVLTDGASEFAASDLGDAKDLAEAVRLAVADKKVIMGTASYRSVVADAKTRTFRVEINVQNADMKLLPGMIVRVVLLRRMVRDAIAIPLFAVVPRDGRAAVYVEKDGRAAERTVTLGVSDGRNIEITSGLTAGGKVIVEGQRQLKDGTLLKVVGEPDGTAAPAVAADGQKGQDGGDDSH